MAVRYSLGIIASVLMVAAGITPVHAASIDVAVVGVSGPWLWQSGGLNSSYAYGINDQTTPTIITNVSGISVTPAQQLTIAYLSGTESAGPGLPFVTAQGDTSDPVNNDPNDTGFGPFPSFYMPTADYPIYISELVGTFADSSGDVVGNPFPVGLSATVTVPSGAAQLQLGVNDNKYSDNSGYFDVQISESTVPEPSTFALLGVASIGMLAFSRKCRNTRMACGAVILWTLPLSAGTIPDLYDTGIGSNGVSLPDGTSPDPHYTIVAGSDGSVASTTTVKTSASGFPVSTGWWSGDSTTSAWIIPSAGYPGNAPPSIYMPVGYYDYLTTFTLPSDANSVSISLNLSADDEAPGILLNGVLVDTPPYPTVNFYDYTPISFASDDVVAGINTLAFETYNIEPSPTGLRVDSIAGTYTTLDVPEPGMISLLGFALLLFRRRQDHRRPVRRM